jgi:hypothetical protein
MDLLAGMAITGIVIGIVFHLSTTVTGQYHALQFNRLELNDLLVTSVGVSCQANTADEIREIPGGFEFVNEGHEIQMKEQRGQLFLINKNSSTLLLKNISEISVDRDEDTILLSLPEELRPITGIHFRTEVMNQPVDLNFYKAYSTSEKINQFLLNSEFED